MPDKNWVKKPKGFSLLELMVIVAIISILIAIALPNYLSMRNKPYCSQAETDADNVAGAISEYFGIPSHFAIPDIDDLDVNVNNPVEISGDPNTTIIITVTDRSGRCPKNFQTNNERWDATTKTYTKYIKY